MVDQAFLKVKMNESLGVKHGKKEEWLTERVLLSTLSVEDF